MKFLVRLPNGAESEHEVLPSGVIGRDKASSLVLDDNRCSRRHATLDADGVTFRDLNSANGMFVNGHRTQEAALKPGDIVLLGGTSLTVLADDVSGTVQMRAEEVEPPPPPATPPAPAEAAPPAAPPDPRPVAAAARPGPPATTVAPAPTLMAAPVAPVARPATPDRDARPQPIDRPFTVTLLALGWASAAVVVPAAGLLAAWRGMAIAMVVATVVAIVSALLAYGLWKRAGWARWGQVAAAAAGLFTPLILPSAAIIYYMMRDDVGLAFARRDWSQLTGDEAEILRTEPREARFAALIAASTAGSVLLAAALAFALWRS